MAGLDERGKGVRGKSLQGMDETVREGKMKDKTGGGTVTRRREIKGEGEREEETGERVKQEKEMDRTEARMRRKVRKGRKRGVGREGYNGRNE